MAARLFLYFTSAGHSLYRWRGRALRLETRFSADDAGLARFREYCNGCGGALVCVVVDLAGEDFHLDQIPYLRGAERRAVIERRLSQRYRDTRLATALSLGYAAEERRNERLLLTSLNNAERFVAWLDVLGKTRVRLAGVYSAPLLAPSLAARLGAKNATCFLLSANRAGLRQCFVENGRLRFSRLERIADTATGASPAFVRAETGRMLQYLGSLRALPRDTRAMRVVLIVPEEQRVHFERDLAPDARLAFTTMGMAEAARKLGMRRTPSDGACELLYLHVAALRPPKEQFARDEDRHSFRLWRLQRSIVAAGMLGFVACAGYAAALWVEGVTVRRQIEGLRLDASRAREQYQRVSARFPATPTTLENLKTIALEFRRISANSASPDDALAHVSQALDRSPQIELDALAWNSAHASETSDAKPESAQAAPRSAAAGPQQTLELSGHVTATDARDYRTIAGHVQRFAAQLGASSQWHVVSTRLPLDISPETTLSGLIGPGADSAGMSRFTIWIARTRE